MSVNAVDSILFFLKLRCHNRFEVITFYDNVVSFVITVTFVCPLQVHFNCIKKIRYQKISTNQTSKQHVMTTKLCDTGLKTFQNLVEHEGFCANHKIRKDCIKRRRWIAVWHGTFIGILTSKTHHVRDP